MRKPTTLFVYLLGTYVILQFIWWGFQLFTLNQKIDASDAVISKKLFMIVGEGAVFLLLLLFGLWRIKRAIQKEIDLANNQKNFMLSITHELKTPLAGIKLYLQTLLRRDLPEEKKEQLLTKSLAENDRLSALVDQILLSAQLEQNNFEVVKSTFSLNECIQHLIKENQLHSSLKIHFVSKEQIEINSDPQILRTILTNLFQNSEKYAGNNARIVIEVEKNVQNIKLTFADNGPGIPISEQSHIFKAFYRIGNEETRKHKGTGLGLYIAYKASKALKGNLSIDQLYKNGARFELNLPYE